MTHRRDATYETTCERMAKELVKWGQTHGRAPRFRLPEKEIALIAVLVDVRDLVAGDDEARVLLDRMTAIGLEVGGPNGHPTVNMLRAICDYLGCPYERIGMAEIAALGRVTLLGPGWIDGAN